MDNVTAFWKALFVFSGIGIFAWGIIGDSMTRTIGGLGCILIAFLISGS